MVWIWIVRFRREFLFAPYHDLECPSAAALTGADFHFDAHLDAPKTVRWVRGLDTNQSLDDSSYQGKRSQPSAHDLAYQAPAVRPTRASPNAWSNEKLMLLHPIFSL